MILLTHRHTVDWTYFTEGNAHIVLTYTGSDKNLVGYVLRLAKSNNNQQLPDGFQNDFRQHIIATLLGSDYIDHTVRVQVTPEFINTINDKIYSHRPLDRRSNAIHHSTSALLTKNWTLCYAPEDTWTFEIKPKWGFLPNSAFIDEKHQQLKKTMCRFCMHQRLRQQDSTKGDISLARHHYCPLDLYSGDPLRIRKALIASLTRPHNYLKFFHNGRSVPPPQWISSFPFIFHHSSQRQQQIDDNKSATSMVDDDWIELVADVLVEILMQDPILQTLKRLQQSLDEYDVEGIYPLYQKHGQQPTHDIDCWKYTIQQFMERQQSKQNFVNRHKNKEKETYPDNNIYKRDEREELQRLYEYLLSMTLKDCSVMICISKGDLHRHQGSTALPRITALTAPRATANGVVMVQSNGSHCFHYKIKVVDVDMKKWNKIPFWFDLDRRIIQHNLQQEQYGRICLD